jgi:hypothetical protein
MVFCTPTNSRTSGNLGKREINSSKEHSPKMMRGYLTVQTARQEKELISDFRDVLELRCLYYCNWEEAHCSYSWQDHSSKGDE